MTTKSELLLSFRNDYEKFIFCKSLHSMLAFVWGYSLVAYRFDGYIDFHEHDFHETLIDRNTVVISVEGASYLNIISDSDASAFDHYLEKLGLYMKTHHFRGKSAMTLPSNVDVDFLRLLVNRPEMCLPFKSIFLLRSFFDGVEIAMSECSFRIENWPDWKAFNAKVSHKYGYEVGARWERIYFFRSEGDHENSIKEFFEDLSDLVYPDSDLFSNCKFPQI